MNASEKAGVGPTTFWFTAAIVSVLGGAVGALLLWGLSLPEKVPTLIQIFQGLLTPLIAIVTAWIAYQQWQANVLRLRLDRYERRLRIYQHLILFLNVTLRDFRPSLKEFFAFAKDTAEADFLFGDDVNTYLAEVRTKSLSIRGRQQEYTHWYEHGIPDHVDYPKFLEEMHQDEAWFTHQHDQAKALFKPYLDLRS